MIKRKLTIGDAILIIVNLVPLYGVWQEGWDARQMFLVYCMETIIIGGYNIFKMLLVTVYKKKDKWEDNGGYRMVSGFFFIFFFIFHYGFFVFVQTGIFTSITGLSKADFNPLSFISNLYSYLTIDTKIVLYLFVFMYGVKMIIDFVITAKYKQTSIGVLMFQPYIRIFIQQFVVIIGSMFLAFGAGKFFMLIFICVKIYFEIFINYDKFLEQAEKMQK